MFFVPLGIWCGADFGVGYYIWKSMIPTALGNMVGGGIFVGAAYWYLYLTGEVGVHISFNIGSEQTALEAGGPMRNIRSKGSREAPDTIIGQDPKDLPHSGGHLQSGIGHELGDHTPFVMSHAERTKGTDTSSDEKV